MKLSLRIACIALGLTHSLLQAATVETVNVPSASMGKEVKALVITPDRHQSEPDRRFPVVYLLHGYSDNHLVWNERVPAIQAEADRRDFIIVCPDGSTSWYLDSPVDPKVKYETFCSSELVSWIDQRYRTVATRQGRATCGLSMGGHGALWLAIRHKQVFGAAVALSGGVDIRPFPENWNLPNLLGHQSEHADHWEKHTVINLIPTLKNRELAIAIDCGTGDFFIGVNRDLHQKLLAAKIEHDYSERPGEHNWDYWSKTFPYAAQFMDTYFDRKPSK